MTAIKNMLGKLYIRDKAFYNNIFLWILSLPLGLLAGFVFHLPAFWIYIFLKADQIAKAVWCVFRLKSGKWIKKIAAA